MKKEDFFLDLIHQCICIGGEIPSDEELEEMWTQYLKRRED